VQQLLAASSIPRSRPPPGFGKQFLNLLPAMLAPEFIFCRSCVVVRTTIIELEGKRLFVLNGLMTDQGEEAPDVLDELVLAARNNPDAVAFGRMAGRWIAAA
jgi:hypothetical protein